MASIFIGLNRGQGDMGSTVGGFIAEGSSTQATDVELRIDTGKGLTRKEVDVITSALIRYLLDGRTTVFGL